MRYTIEQLINEPVQPTDDLIKDLNVGIALRLLINKVVDLTNRVNELEAIKNKDM